MGRLAHRSLSSQTAPSCSPSTIGQRGDLSRPMCLQAKQPTRRHRGVTRSRGDSIIAAAVRVRGSHSSASLTLDLGGWRRRRHRGGVVDDRRWHRGRGYVASATTTTTTTTATNAAMGCSTCCFHMGRRVARSGSKQISRQTTEATP